MLLKWAARWRIQVGYAGLKALVPLTTLTSLNAAGCENVGDLCMAVVSQMKNLKALNLEWCALSDRGQPSFHSVICPVSSLSSCPEASVSLLYIKMASSFYSEVQQYGGEDALMT